MSETLTIFGIDYPNTEGFKAKDDLGTTHTYGEGGGGGGVDIPVFEVIFDDDYEEVISTSCNKTFAECYALYNNQMQSGMVVMNIESGTDEASYPVYAWSIGGNATYVQYVLYCPYADTDVIYRSNGTIELIYPSSLARDSSDLSLSGNTVTAPAGSYAEDAYINVPGGTPTLQSKSVIFNPSENAQSQTLTPDAGYDGLSQVTASVNALSNTYVGSGIPRRDYTDFVISGGTFTAPAGYYATDATDEIAYGTAGTPTATKGTVSNNAVTVTPSVTNTTGYITGGTKTGTGVIVRASDLVSGTVYLDEPGSWNVANAETAVITGGTATPAASISATGATVSTATNTLTLSKTVSNTPQVSAGYITAGTAGNSSVSLTATVTTQAAQTIYPSASDQTIASGRYLTGTQTTKAVTTTNLTAANIKSGVTVQVGDSADPDRVTSVTGTYTGGSSMNTQIWLGRAQRTANSYGATDATITVAKTGTYTVSWTAWRSSSSGTMGTNLHVNDTTGTNQQTFTGTYGQNIQLTNQRYNAGDVLTVYATSGSTSRSIYVSNLIIEQTA